MPSLDGCDSIFWAGFLTGVAALALYIVIAAHGGGMGSGDGGGENKNGGECGEAQ